MGDQKCASSNCGTTLDKNESMFGMELGRVIEVIPALSEIVPGRPADFFGDWFCSRSCLKFQLVTIPHRLRCEKAAADRAQEQRPEQFGVKGHSQPCHCGTCPTPPIA